MARKDRKYQTEENVTVQFLLRLPITLRDRLGREAERERRSMTAQLIRILEERYESVPEMSLRKAG